MQSLRLKRDFYNVFSKGRWITTRNSPVKIKTLVEGESFEVGLILSRKTGNAVQRNKAKRQVRSILHEIYKNKVLRGKFAIIFTRQFVKCTYKEKRDRISRIIQNSFHQ